MQRTLMMLQLFRPARRMQRTAEAMLQFGMLGPQYETEVEQGTLVKSMIGP